MQASTERRRACSGAIAFAGPPSCVLTGARWLNFKMFNFAMHCLLSSKQSAGEQATTDELHELPSTAGIEPATSAVSSGALPTEKYPLSTPPANFASLRLLPLLP